MSAYVSIDRLVFKNQYFEEISVPLDDLSKKSTSS